ncbi:GldG family protein [Anaeromyxobacter paludicola]|uniref:ABC-type uncharacterized transport system domain-containing protein n=1 Tax=Anaeromyxobacter paludicola TaxID=2918171 RepID=A0ABN6N788_9BACT|nr:Gldg family protein [Anaeromyxobacter paludicola]BDG08901.1 hypothetical protein AMPC_20140 [Anaeromyxobacter paludicola]
MKKNVWSRVLSALGLMLLLSTFVTFLFGNTQLVAAKALLGLAGIAAGLALSESGGARRFFTGRAAHFGFFTGVSALCVVALLGTANWLAYRRPHTWDLTKNQLFTLSEDTVRTLRGLPVEVSALAFYRQDEPDYPAAQDLLRRYAALSPRFTWRLVDPYRSPELVKQYGITDTGPRLVVTAQGAKGDARVRQPTEQELTNAVVKLTRGGEKKLYFVQGHGEPDPRDEGQKGYGVATRSLESEGIEVGTLVLLERAQVPADAAAVIVAGAKKPLLAPELKALQDYAARGGHLGVFLEPAVDAGLGPLLASFGVEADDDIVLDPSPVAQLFGGTALTPMVQPTQRHPITRDIAQTALAFPTTRSLVALTGARSAPTPLALSGRESWGETDLKGLFSTGAEQDEGEKRGPLPVAMAAARPPEAQDGRRSAEARLVVAGSSAFFANQYQQLLGNLDFFLNAASWLAEREDRITIRPKGREATTLFLTEAQVTMLKFLTIDVLPVSLLGLGLAVWLVRRGK